MIMLRVFWTHTMWHLAKDGDWVSQHINKGDAIAAALEAASNEQGILEIENREGRIVYSFKFEGAPTPQHTFE